MCTLTLVSHFCLGRCWVGTKTPHLTRVRCDGRGARGLETLLSTTPSSGEQSSGVDAAVPKVGTPWIGQKTRLFERRSKWV